MTDDVILFPGWPHVGGGSQGDGGGDAGAGDAGTAGAGDGGDGGSEANVDLEQVAADFEAQALEELGGQPPTDGAEAEDGQPGKGARRAAALDPVDEFIQQNYQGNRVAFIAGLHEQRQEGRRQAAEIESLKQQFAAKPPAPRDVAAEIKAALESSPDVQAIDHDIQAIDTENRGIGARQLEIATRAGTCNNEIIQLEAQLPHIEDQKEWAKTYSTISRLRTELATLSGEFNTNELRQKQNASEKKNLGRERQRADREIRQRMADEENRNRSQSVSDQRTRETFSAAFDALIEPFGFDPKSPQYAYARNATRTQLADFLESLGSEAEALDAAGIYDAVHKLVGAYAEAHNLRPKPKTPVAPPRPRQPRALGVRVPGGTAGAGQRPAGSTPRTADDVLSDPDLVRKRANAVFEAASRGQARRGPPA